MPLVLLLLLHDGDVCDGQHLLGHLAHVAGPELAHPEDLVDAVGGEEDRVLEDLDLEGLAQFGLQPQYGLALFPVQADTLDRSRLHVSPVEPPRRVICSNRTGTLGLLLKYLIFLQSINC